MTSVQEQEQDQSLLAIDWGTSSFRLHEVKVKGGESTVTTLQESSDGLATLKGADIEEFLAEALQDKPQWPVLMSGMVGSNIGLHEAPYLDCPVNAPELAGQLVSVALGTLKGRQLYIVPGLRTTTAGGAIDVMRGEEVQALGWLKSNGNPDGEHLLCLPGTHSKWLKIDDRAIVNSSTALTGELYQLLSEQSLLVWGKQEFSEAEFLLGVNAAVQESGLIHQLFVTRARVVGGGESSAHTGSYLSGLLIGSELCSIMTITVKPAINFIGSDALLKRYSLAAQELGLKYTCSSGLELAAQGLALLWSLYDE